MEEGTGSRDLWGGVFVREEWKGGV